MTNHRPPKPARDRLLERALGIHCRLYRKLLRLIPDVLSLQPGTARTSKSPGWMDLHLDVLDVQQPAGMKWLRISLAHYYEQNGDKVPDPDMELRVCLDPRWPSAEALNITHPTGHFSQVYPEPGKVDPRARRELNAFLEMWLKNALQQGHRLGPDTTRRPN